MSAEEVPRRIEMPKRLRIALLSSSPRTRELYIRIESMCSIPNGGGAMNPSCSPMTSASHFSSSSPEPVGRRRAVILKNGPKVFVSSARPRFFAAIAISSRVTMDAPVDAAVGRRPVECSRCFGDAMVHRMHRVNIVHAHARSYRWKRPVPYQFRTGHPGDGARKSNQVDVFSLHILSR